MVIIITRVGNRHVEWILILAEWCHYVEVQIVHLTWVAPSITGLSVCEVDFHNIEIDLVDYAWVILNSFVLVHIKDSIEVQSHLRAFLVWLLYTELNHLPLLRLEDEVEQRKLLSTLSHLLLHLFCYCQVQHVLRELSVSQRRLNRRIRALSEEHNGANCVVRMLLKYHAVLVPPLARAKCLIVRVTMLVGCTRSIKAENATGAHTSDALSIEGRTRIMRVALMQINLVRGHRFLGEGCLNDCGCCQ